ncbi:MAG: Ig-like domain-containing protein, partial [Acutalibacteraceae bacterium]|nr:Ig-like domain-containing protein [Acutalibacteraceae bacterium]
GVKSIYEFTNGGRAKGVVVDERDGKYDCTDWFNAVVTPDTLINGDTSFVTGVSVSPATASLQVGTTRGLTVNVSVTSGHAPYSGGIRWQTTNEQVATISAAGLVTAVGVGQAIVSAEVGNYASGCIVTVTAGS